MGATAGSAGVSLPFDASNWYLAMRSDDWSHANAKRPPGSRVRLVLGWTIVDVTSPSRPSAATGSTASPPPQLATSRLRFSLSSATWHGRLPIDGR